MSSTYQDISHFRSTKNSSIKIRNYASSKNLLWCWLLILSLMLVEVCQSKQLILLPSLKTKNEKILLRLLHQTNYLVKYDRMISNQLMNCISVIKNDLTKNTPGKIEAINQQLDYIQILELNKKRGSSDVSQSQTLAYKIDALLDRLKGVCLYYSSTTFIYEYCHKQHMRQFDSENTRINNQKPLYQDISMGLFNPDLTKQRKQKQNIPPLTEQQKKVIIPGFSNFQKVYNHLFVEDLNRNQGDLEVYESDDGNILHSSVYLQATKRFVDIPIILSLSCVDSSSQLIQNFAILATSYDLIYTRKIGSCQRLVSFQKVNVSANYFDDSSKQPIRILGSYLYGNMEKRCTENVAWQKDNKEQIQNYLQSGNVLFLEIYNYKEKNYEHHYVTIKQVINSELVSLEAPLGRSFYRQKKEGLDYTDYIPKRLIQNITKCQLFYRKPVNFNIRATGNYYLGHNIMRFNDTVFGKDLSNTKLACLAESQAVRKVGLEVWIGQHLWLNYYKTQITTSTDMLHPMLLKALLTTQYILSVCYPFIQIEKRQTDNTQASKFTKIVKLTNKNRVLNISSVNPNQVFIIKVKNAGILRLHTTDEDGNSIVYLLSEGQMIKVRQFSNGTKQIIKQNKVYENDTQPGVEQQNYIYIHASFLPNKTAYGMIWKYSDHVIFPRFTFFNEIITSFQIVQGYAYIRILNSDKMHKKQSLAILKYSKLVQQLYTKQIEEDSLAEDKRELFENSYSINYTYTSGDYCGQPINKFRKTIVTIKCGKAWFQIIKLLQTSPCEYLVQIQSTILCQENFKDVVQIDELIPNKIKEDQIIFNGVMCLPKYGLFDEAYHYFSVQQKI